jgi:predicted lipase
MMNKYLLGLSVIVAVAISGCLGGGGSGSKSLIKAGNCPDYRGTLATLMVQAAALSYESDQAVLQAQVSQLGLTLDEIKIKDSGTGTQGFLAYNDKLVVVAFRGSEDLKDWFGNAKAWDNEVKASADCDKKVTVHQGFQDAVQSVTKNGVLHERIAVLLKGGRKLYVTGHSLGGALAA